MPNNDPTSIELCAGAGGQALGLEQAGFRCVGAFEIDRHAADTLRANRPDWRVVGGNGESVAGDIRSLDPSPYKGIDLLAAGVPCPPFSIAGKQLGANDDRDLFPAALKLVGTIKPAAVLFENVKGFAQARFADYRSELIRHLEEDFGYYVIPPAVLNAADFGVPQLRSRFVLIAFRSRTASLRFTWPKTAVGAPPTVGSTLVDLMGKRGWPGAKDWAARANRIAPTIVGGSKKHGGADLGPTRAKNQWAEIAVDGHGVWDEAPGPEFPRNSRPRLTTRMAARIQGFPDDWYFSGGKTAVYRQIGNAFPPPVAKAIGLQIKNAIVRSIANPVQEEREAAIEAS